MWQNLYVFYIKSLSLVKHTIVKIQYTVVLCLMILIIKDNKKCLAPMFAMRN